MANMDLQILVVDDESFVLNLCVRILGKLGYPLVETASDGADALTLMQGHKRAFDLVICDLNMPEVDGIEFMRLAHEAGYRGALILLSGEDRRMLETAQDLALAQNINVRGFIQKPLKPDVLEALLLTVELQANQPAYALQQAITRQELEAGIHDHDSQELVLFYQPKVHIESGSIATVEALARWQHSERGLLGPGAFIPVAEQEGLIDPLSFAIYRKVVQQVSEWQIDGLNLTASINFSINTFALENFSAFLLDTAEAYGISPTQLMLEVTETQVMENATNCLEVMMRLRLKKFGLSIDDFGTGHSSMVQLKNIPFTELKIDRAFVNGALHNHSARAILEASVALAKNLEMSTVAEGVETRAEWDLVDTLGVDYVQGFYCAKPMPNAELLGFLGQWQGPH